VFWQPAVPFLAGRCVADQPAAVPGTERAATGIERKGLRGQNRADMERPVNSTSSLALEVIVEQTRQQPGGKLDG